MAIKNTLFFFFNNLAKIKYTYVMISNRVTTCSCVSNSFVRALKLTISFHIRSRIARQCRGRYIYNFMTYCYIPGCTGRVRNILLYL